MHSYIVLTVRHHLLSQSLLNTISYFVAVALGNLSLG